MAPPDLFLDLAIGPVTDPAEELSEALFDQDTLDDLIEPRTKTTKQPPLAP